MASASVITNSSPQPFLAHTRDLRCVTLSYIDLDINVNLPLLLSIESAEKPRTTIQKLTLTQVYGLVSRT